MLLSSSTMQLAHFDRISEQGDCLQGNLQATQIQGFTNCSEGPEANSKIGNE